MPYGLKQGVKAPGNYGFTDIAGLAVAGSAGILAALVTDYQQSGEASALYTINQWAVAAAKIIGFGDVPLWSVVAGLVGVGAVSIFYFQPITRQGAFAQGFGLLAVLMTAVPADLAGGLEAITNDGLQDLQPVSFQREASYQTGPALAGIIPATFSAGEARVYQVEDERGGAKYVVHIVIQFPDGLSGDLDSMLRKGEMRGRLHNADTDETFNLFRTAGGAVKRRGNTLYIDAGVPARSNTAKLWVRIEAAGYSIEEQSAEARLNNKLDWTISMQPSSTPLFMQRLNKSYWF